MFKLSQLSLGLVLTLSGTPLVWAQDRAADTQLLQRLAEDESRIKALEAMIQELMRGPPAASAAVPEAAAPDPGPPPILSVPLQSATLPAAPAAASVLPAAVPPAIVPDPEADVSHDHMMAIPGGPTLHFRGFFDIDFDKGSVAQNLQYPLGVPATASFRTGEFDLFVTSQLSPRLSFLSEIVFGEGPENTFDVDVERYELTFKASRYFEISAGRYHSAIGYYNTAYHHGVWFSTATGRPFMYYWEDSGGVLPVHELGMTTTGYVPGSGKFDLHWTAEIGNGSSSAGSLFGDGVEGFASNRNRKDVNFALYSRPKWIPGLQVGASHLNGDLAPPGLPRVNQTISSVYVTYVTPKWEFLNEVVLLHHQVTNGGRSYNSPLAYTQIAYTIGKYRPYFRFQEVNIPNNDPVAAFTGRYEGPSFGLRWDLFDYAALKFQYNRVWQRYGPPQNGFETQLAFVF